MWYGLVRYGTVQYGPVRYVTVQYQYGIARTLPVVSALHPAYGVRATDPVIVRHHQLQGHPLGGAVREHNMEVRKTSLFGAGGFL